MFTDRLQFVETFPASILLYYVLVFTYPRGRKAPKGDKLAKHPRGHVITGMVQMTVNNVYLNSFAVELIYPERMKPTLLQISANAFRFGTNGQNVKVTSGS